jgi:hypothetical protein
MHAALSSCIWKASARRAADFKVEMCPYEKEGRRKHAHACGGTKAWPVQQRHVRREAHGGVRGKLSFTGWACASCQTPSPSLVETRFLPPHPRARLLLRCSRLGRRAGYRYASRLGLVAETLAQRHGGWSAKNPVGLQPQTLTFRPSTTRECHFKRKTQKQGISVIRQAITSARLGTTQTHHRSWAKLASDIQAPPSNFYSAPRWK